MRIVTILLFFYCISGLSQDLIVTKQRDSISCKILKIKKETIYFVYKDSKDAYSSTLLPMDKVDQYKYKYFDTKIPKEALPGYRDYKRVRISLNGGYSWDSIKLSNDIPDYLVDYYKNLQSGYHIGSNVIYYIHEKLGFGLNYNIMNTSNSMQNVTFINNDGSESVGTLADNISASFIGVISSLRFLNKSNTNGLIWNSSIGYLAFKNEQIRVSDYSLKGNSFAVASEIGYDIGITEDISIGAQIGIISGRIKKLEDNFGQRFELKKEERPQGAARLDFSIGIRYNL